MKKFEILRELPKCDAGTQSEQILLEKQCQQLSQCGAGCHMPSTCVMGREGLEVGRVRFLCCGEQQQGGWSLSALGPQLRTWELAHSWEPQSPWKILFWGRGSDGVQEGRAWHLGRGGGEAESRTRGCGASVLTASSANSRRMLGFEPRCGYPGITGPSPARPLRLVPCSHRPHWAVDAGPTPFLEQERGVSGASSDPTPTPFCTLDSETQEEVVRDIARQLAQIGDRMECSISPGLVAGLAAQFSNTSLSEEDRRRCLAAALQQLTRLYPADVDREKTLLLLTLLVAKKVADHSPAVLQDVFHTTVTFINQNLLAYVRNLVQNEMD
ncbi:BH3-interacting domain death agonist isoform X2 [Phocoena sinus]|uniref:BH3-interacting domain death agonist n=1 Tax=Phocoena sinus TaxID=42100 RepID=A0A8C9EG93_PHOSS|nr:BH3-interacting domain death agonist isoform X2 [Phocoena sinus]